MAPMLEIIGLPQEAERVYEEMLTARPATVLDLAVATGLALSRVRTALRLLVARGLVNRVDGAPGRYVAVTPAIALDVLLLEREDQLKRARARAAQISEQFRQATAAHDPAGLIEVITGRDTIAQRVDQLERSARRVARYLDGPPYHTDPGPPNPAELDLLRRGGQARAIYEGAALEYPGRLAHIEVCVSAGETARVLPELPTKLLLVDDRLAAVPLRARTAGSLGPSFVIVHPSALLDALSGLFETLWQLALPLDLAGEQASVSPGGLDDMARRILAFMNAGLPDEAIARQLGLSHRTLQRRIHVLMDQLHARTRYQLGARAALLGEAPAQRDAR